MKDDHSTEASAVLCDLAAALTDAGITLPSLGLERPPAWVGDSGPSLVDLGRCNLATARLLAAAVRAGVASE